MVLKDLEHQPSERFSLTEAFIIFCIKVGFILPVCCYVKLIKQLFVSLLLLFGLNFILIHAKKAITVKDFQSKVKAVTISYIRCWFKTTTHFVYLLTSCICMKQWFSVMSLYISCFNICRLLFNKLRIGINISALSTIILSIRRITLGYVIHLSNIKVSELACMKYLARRTSFQFNVAYRYLYVSAAYTSKSLVQLVS